MAKIPLRWEATTYKTKHEWRQMIKGRSACAWPHADRWLSVDEIAVYLGIKPDTVYKWISERQMNTNYFHILLAFIRVHSRFKRGLQYD